VTEEEGDMKRFEEAQLAELDRFRRMRVRHMPDEREFQIMGINPPMVQGNVLDVGGGVGRYSAPFTRANVRIVADPLYHAFVETRAILTPALVHGVTAYGELLPFRTSAFDLIILRNVIDHMLAPDELLRETLRVVKPDGSVYFMVNVFISLVKPLFLIMAKLDKPHPLHFTLGQIRDRLEALGFLIKRERICRSGRLEFSLKRVGGVLIKREYYAVLTKK
jgi:SAM-dependent methyltransferase